MIAESKRRALELFSEGRRRYKLMDFQGALQSFEQALGAEPSDGPSKIYAERCRHYLENPPPDDWDGVFVMTSK